MERARFKMKYWPIRFKRMYVHIAVAREAIEFIHAAVDACQEGNFKESGNAGSRRNPFG
jgi:hypothetical protein